MKYILLIDFGSTYTKLTLVSKEREDIVLTSKSRTTVEEGVMRGFERALSKVHKTLKEKEIYIGDSIEYKVCSSAAGGLKMVACGLVSELTAEAAKMACLGSGAKVIKVCSNKMTTRGFSKVMKQKPDMILLSGGTDGGNLDCILHNSEIIAGEKVNIPVIVAGNNQAEQTIKKRFDQAGIDHIFTGNVMPHFNRVDIDPARNAIRDLFMERIIDAKGLGVVRRALNENVIPTPLSVLNAAQLLSKGTPSQPGWGALMVVDVGGATTDVHTVCSGAPQKPSVVQVGLIEPELKRTVEGDLGMRISAESLLDSVGMSALQKRTGFSAENVNASCAFRVENPDFLCRSNEDALFDDAMAKCAVETSVSRHAGTIETVYSPMGNLFYQRGKDLSSVKHIIGTGGILVHSESSEEILMHALAQADESLSLKPFSASLYKDASYILSCAGLIAETYPELAMKIMNNHLVQI